MKLCIRCNLLREDTQFYPKRAKCKICYIEQTAIYKQNNEEAEIQRNKGWRAANPEKVMTRRKSYYLAHLEHERKQNKEWAKNNRDSCNAIGAKYRGRKLQATPNWLTEEQLIQIQTFYASALSPKSDKVFCVDHIIPLQGDHVCGLHVPWNLQLLPDGDNKRKGKKFDFTYNNQSWKS
jgi:hypothetical protein